MPIMRSSAPASPSVSTWASEVTVLEASQCFVFSMLQELWCGAGSSGPYPYQRQGVFSPAALSSASVAPTSNSRRCLDQLSSRCSIASAGGCLQPANRAHDCCDVCSFGLLLLSSCHVFSKPIREQRFTVYIGILWFFIMQVDPSKIRPRQRTLRSSTKSAWKVFQLNQAPTELPGTFAWLGKRMWCEGRFWYPLLGNADCWHMHTPNKRCCSRVLAPKHAAPSRPEICKLVPDWSKHAAKKNIWVIGAQKVFHP